VRYGDYYNRCDRAIQARVTYSDVTVESGRLAACVAGTMGHEQLLGLEQL